MLFIDAALACLLFSVEVRLRYAPMRHGGREVALGRHTEIPGSLAMSRSEQNMELFMNLAAADVSPLHPEPDLVRAD